MNNSNYSSNYNENEIQAQSLEATEFSIENIDTSIPAPNISEEETKRQKREKNKLAVQKRRTNLTEEQKQQ